MMVWYLKIVKNTFRSDTCLCQSVFVIFAQEVFNHAFSEWQWHYYQIMSWNLETIVNMYMYVTLNWTFKYNIMCSVFINFFSNSESHDMLNIWLSGRGSSVSPYPLIDLWTVMLYQLIIYLDLNDYHLQNVSREFT